VSNRVLLDHPFADPPATGQVIQVAPGIRWFRMPLPFALDHINLWALEDGEDGLVLIDTGLGGDATKALWDQLLAGPLGDRKPNRLVCTHFHPDHMGLAGWLCKKLGIELTASLREWLFARMLWLETDSPEFAQNQLDYYARVGFDAAQVDAMRERGNGYRTRIDVVPVRVVAIRHGDELKIGGRTWRMIEGGGHSPEHACLYSEADRILISGDQVLPRISPIIGVWPQQPEAEPLSLFLGALDRLRELPADTLVLPSHGLPFRGLVERIDEIKRHHDDRLAKAVEACARPATAAEVLRHLFKRELDQFQTGLALGESLAHLHHLRAKGLIVREARADGVWTYRVS
jgi:glyoxylase-like metal-dependent hydrolase (beta-lactamase superfamily II)